MVMTISQLLETDFTFHPSISRQQQHHRTNCLDEKHFLQNSLRKVTFNNKLFYNNF